MTRSLKQHIHEASELSQYQIGTKLASGSAKKCHWVPLFEKGNFLRPHFYWLYSPFQKL